MRSKPTILGLCLLLLLSVFEGMLRLAGSFISSARAGAISAEIEVADGLETYGAGYPERPRIVFAGDSFTCGDGVSIQQTFPFQLYRLLQDIYDPHVVLNLGRPGASTQDVADQLENLVEDEVDFDAVVVLVGRADSRVGGSHPDGRPTGSHSQGPRLLAVARALRTAWTHQELRREDLIRALRGRPQCGRRYVDDPSKDDGAVVDEQRLRRLEGLYDDFRRAGLLRQEGRSNDARRAFANGLRSWREIGLTGVSDPALNDTPVDEGSMRLAHLQASMEVLQQQYAQAARHDDAFERLLDLARNFPEFWSNRPQWRSLRSTFVQVGELQTRYGPSAILATLDTAQKSLPEIADLDPFMSYWDSVQNRNAHRERTRQQREASWKRIAKICETRGIPLVAANYPVDYRLANQGIRAAATRHRLPHVDNFAHFASVVARDGRAHYLQGGRRCTAAGYRQIAGTVLNVLVENKIVGPGRLKAR